MPAGWWLLFGRLRSGGHVVGITFGLTTIALTLGVRVWRKTGGLTSAHRADE